jgi:hypothetical protein
MRLARFALYQHCLGYALHGDGRGNVQLRRHTMRDVDHGLVNVSSLPLSIFIYFVGFITGPTSHRANCSLWGLRVVILLLMMATGFCRARPPERSAWRDYKF